MYIFNADQYDICNLKLKEICKDKRIEFEDSEISWLLDKIKKDSESFIFYLNRKKDPNYLIAINEQRSNLTKIFKRLKEISGLNLGIKDFVIEEKDEPEKA